MGPLVLSPYVAPASAPLESHPWPAPGASCHCPPGKASLGPICPLGSGGVGAQRGRRHWSSFWSVVKVSPSPCVWQEGPAAASRPCQSLSGCMPPCSMAICKGGRGAPAEGLPSGSRPLASCGATCLSPQVLCPVCPHPHPSRGHKTLRVLSAA